MWQISLHTSVSVFVYLYFIFPSSLNTTLLHGQRLCVFNLFIYLLWGFFTFRLFLLKHGLQRAALWWDASLIIIISLLRDNNQYSAGIPWERTADYSRINSNKLFFRSWNWNFLSRCRTEHVRVKQWDEHELFSFLMSFLLGCLGCFVFVVDSKVFLLLCGAMAVFLTLVTALCCLTMMLKTTSRRSNNTPGSTSLYLLYGIEFKWITTHEFGKNLMLIFTNVPKILIQICDKIKGIFDLLSVEKTIWLYFCLKM